VIVVPNLACMILTVLFLILQYFLQCSDSKESTIACHLLHYPPASSRCFPCSMYVFKSYAWCERSIKLTDDDNTHTYPPLYCILIRSSTQSPTTLPPIPETEGPEDEQQAHVALEVLGGAEGMHALQQLLPLFNAHSLPQVSY